MTSVTGFGSLLASNIVELGCFFPIICSLGHECRRLRARSRPDPGKARPAKCRGRLRLSSLSQDTAINATFAAVLLGACAGFDAHNPFSGCVEEKASISYISFLCRRARLRLVGPRLASTRCWSSLLQERSNNRRPWTVCRASATPRPVAYPAGKRQAKVKLPAFIVVVTAEDIALSSSTSEQLAAVLANGATAVLLLEGNVAGALSLTFAFARWW